MDGGSCDPPVTLSRLSHLHRFDVTMPASMGDQRSPGDARTRLRIAQQVKPLSSGRIVLDGEAVDLRTGAPLNQRIVCHAAILSGNQFQHLDGAGFFRREDPGDLERVGGERCGHGRFCLGLPYPTASGTHPRPLIDKDC